MARRCHRSNHQLHLAEREDVAVHQRRVVEHGIFGITGRDAVGRTGSLRHGGTDRDVVGMEMGVEDVREFGLVFGCQCQVPIDVCRWINHGHRVPASTDRIGQAGLGHPVELNDEVGAIVEEDTRNQGVGPEVHAAVEVLHIGFVHHLDDHPRRSSMGTDGDDILAFGQGRSDGLDIAQSSPIGDVHRLEGEFAFDPPTFELIAGS